MADPSVFNADPQIYTAQYPSDPSGGAAGGISGGSSGMTSMAGAGGSLAGAILGFIGQRAALNEQKREFNKNLVRKNALLGAAMPDIMAGLGYNGSVIPSQGGQILGQASTGIVN